jgi:hypothetical protein
MEKVLLLKLRIMGYFTTKVLYSYHLESNAKDYKLEQLNHLPS